MNLTIDDLIKRVSVYNIEGIERIKKAYNMASVFHSGQKRQSGEDYIVHPLNVAYILAEMHADTDTLCAALLHDTLEDTTLTKEEIIKEFNLDVAEMVDGVTKISGMNFSSKTEQNLANTRKIITSITKDVRIIIIKLADRLHNMRTLQYKTPFKQKENALETMEIFVPLAYYIGAYRIKSELEDISFSYLNPDDYKKLEVQKNELENSVNPYLEEMKYNIQDKLYEKNINSAIKIRIKNIYGIYKRLNKGYKISEIYDLHALKIMVNTIDECYLTLGVIHSLYKPLNRFKDYIYNPKLNMYRSLHTTVFGLEDILVQNQIRTFDMDNIASFGLTAYWDIVDDARSKMQEVLKQKFQFFNSLKEIDKMFNDNTEFVDHVKQELFADKVYVYTPRGDIIELPKGSTVIDFAYKIHTDLGNNMIGAKVNDEDVNLDCVLKNKDRVKIITNNLSTGPKNEWLNLATTTRAKRKIKEFIRSD